LDEEIKGRKLILRLMQSLGVGCVILVVIYYIFPSAEIGRVSLFVSANFLFLIFFTLRVLYFKFMDIGKFKESVLIVGSGRLAKNVGEILHTKRDLGYKIVGFIDNDPEKLGKKIVNPGVIGDYKKLTQIIEQWNIKKVIVALPDRRGNLPLNELLQCKVKGIKIIDGVSFYEQISGKISVEELKPSWLIFSGGFKKPRSLQILKRLFDITFSIIGLFLAFPIFLLVPLLIRLGSPGPVFYRQERVGENGRIFTLLKFRSMTLNAESVSGPVWAKKDDPRVTRVGKILRKTRIDELPQMVNVLKGEMSFVGPRPERAHFIEELIEKIPYYSIRHTVKPGITGWAQIKFRYGSSVDDALEKLQYDLFYVKNMSLFFDLTVVFQTIKIVLIGAGAR
jgi:sugar transferase (PEP-CTERM system associated)